KCVKRSQIEGPRPSSFTAPSTWKAEVAVPHRKSPGKANMAFCPVGRLMPASADWADTVDSPSAADPAILPKWRRDSPFDDMSSLLDFALGTRTIAPAQ